MRYTVLLAILLTGCASSSPTYTASGKQGHSINCSGTARNWGHCLEKAGEICGARGYDVLDRSDQRGAVVGANSQGLFATSTFNRTMVIACK
jgi:hypothetical protein